MERFAASVAQSEGTITISLSGNLDETAKLPMLDVRGSTVVIDAGGVDRISSLGVRNWLHYMSNLSENAGRVVLRKLSPQFVAQICMIQGFAGPATIESFFVPWSCQQCGHEEDKLFPYSAEIPSTVACSKCSGSMILDDEPEFFLSFRDRAVR